MKRLTCAILSSALVSTLIATGAGAAAPTASARPILHETPDRIVLRGSTYEMTILKAGFRYGFVDAAGESTLPAHGESGLRLRRAGSEDFADAVDTRLVNDPRAPTAVLDVQLEDGSTVRVHVHPSPTTVRITVDDLPGTPATVDLRTGPVGPVYGLGDYGAHENGQPDQGTPCSGNVEARSSTELTGIVLDNLTNEGSCKRFVSTFAVLPKQRAGQVIFDEGQKRVGFTASENRLGVAGVESVNAVHYFLGGSLEQVYADYKAAREAHGYVDPEPRPDFFELGWEAYGALAWDTYQSSVMETVQSFIDHGYPLSWGVVGSGFWPGPRGRPQEGTTNSFGMWDDTFEPGREDAQPGLPNPRYPDPDGLKSFFADNDLKLLLGSRNNFKAYPHDGGNYIDETYDGPFMPEAEAAGYLLTDPDGTPTVVTRSLFPSGASYVLDGSNEDAVAWYADRMRAWGVDGWKEDTSHYAPDLHLDGNLNPVQIALAEAGDLVMVRNAAYSVPGDIIRINDTIYGTGEVFHEDPDRMPVNLLNMAGSGPGNLYPDYVGGTPGPLLTDPAYMDYFVRNAQFNALTPVLAFGKGPWELDRSDYAGQVKDLALWHSALHPYIYDAVLDGHETGFPYAMTPLPVAYPDDENTYDLANDETRQYEWLLGESLLATPVFGSDFETAQARDVYLPEGKWIDYDTGAVFTGPRTLEDYAIGTDRVPAFVGGKGVLVSRAGDDMVAEVYPIATGSTYEWTNGEANSRVINRNSGWDPGTLRVTDQTTGETVPFELDEVTGAFRFPFEPDHDYELSGGGNAEHSVPVETETPSTAPTGITHEVDDGLVTLSWDPVDNARSYVVTVEGGGRCEAGVAGSTSGTSLGLGDLEQAAGTYTINAVNAVGAGPASDPYTIEGDGEPAPTTVIVTNEGAPALCDWPAYSEQGSGWASSSLSGFDGSGTRYTFTAGRTATWRAELDPGTYGVDVWFPAHSSCSSNVTYRVVHAGGVAEIPVDQCATGGEWLHLGNWDFPPDDGDLSRVLLVAGSGATRADAVRFTPVS